MARLAKTESSFLEQKEGDLGRLASALVLLELVQLRVGLAAKKEPAILSPAVEDLQHVSRLVAAAQRSISTLSPCLARAEED